MRLDCCLVMNSQHVKSSGNLAGLKDISETGLETIKAESRKRKDILHVVHGIKFEVKHVIYRKLVNFL